MYIKTIKQLLAALAVLSAIFAQNDGLVVTKYNNGGYLTQKSLNNIRYQLQKRGKLCQKKKLETLQTQ